MILNVLVKQGYAKVVGFSAAGVHGDIHKQWRYTAIEQKTGPTGR